MTLFYLVAAKSGKICFQLRTNLKSISTTLGRNFWDYVFDLYNMCEDDWDVIVLNMLVEEIVSLERYLIERSEMSCRTGRNP